jgi:hypothetical protein
MTRETSRIAYGAVMECEWLPKKYKEIFDYYYKNGPLTINMLFKGTIGSTTINQPNLHARVREMVDMDILAELPDKMPCAVNGNTVLWFDVSGRVPKRPTERLSKDKQIAELKLQVETLTKENAELKERLAAGVYNENRI